MYHRALTKGTATCPKAVENQLCWKSGEMGASWQHLVVMMLLTSTFACTITKTILCLHLKNTENNSTCTEAFLSQFLKLSCVKYV